MTCFFVFMQIQHLVKAFYHINFTSNSIICSNSTSVINLCFAHNGKKNRKEICSRTLSCRESKPFHTMSSSGWQSRLEHIPAVTGQDTWYRHTMDRSLFHHKANKERQAVSQTYIQTNNQFRITINLTFITLDFAEEEMKATPVKKVEIWKLLAVRQC